jgi:hypothetical protein
MTDFQFWQEFYRGLMMIAKAIVKYKLTKSPSGERSIVTDGGLIAGSFGYDIDTAPEKV